MTIETPRFLEDPETGDELADYRAVIRTVTAGWDSDTVRAWEQDGSLDRSVFSSLGQAGCFERRWSRGRNAGLRHAVVLAEELCLVSGGVGLAVSLHAEVFLGILHPLARTGSQLEVRDAALAGSAIGCFAATEAGAGSDLDGISTVAHDRDGAWHLVGQKRFTSNLRTATHAVVLARVLEASREAGPLAAFLVPLDAPGVTVDGQYRTLGVLSCSTGQLSLDVSLPGDALLGGRRTSLMYVKRALDGERILAAAQALAACRFALRLATTFCRHRRVQGQRLMDQSALRQRLASGYVELWGAEALLESVVSMATAGRDVSRRAAAVKLLSAAVSGRLVDEVIQSLGGRGYLEHFVVERLWRDARLLRIGGGSDEVMREIVAAGIDREDEEMTHWLSNRETADWIEAASVPWP